MNKVDIYLASGTLEGVVGVKYDEFPGRLIKVHDDHISNYDDSSEQEKAEIDKLKRPGVYFLCGKKPNGEDAVYVGESENVYNRITEHTNDIEAGRKSFDITTVFAYTRSGLEKEKRLYLEYHFYQLLKGAHQYKCDTRKVEKPSIDSYSVDKMNIALENIQLMLQVIGCNIFGNICTIKKKYVTLYCDDSGSEARAYYQEDESFVVLTDSKISDTVQDDVSENYRNLRKELESNGTIINGKFVKDYTFNKITPATNVVCGRNIPGKRIWKTKEGISIKDGGGFIISNTTNKRKKRK